MPQISQIKISLIEPKFHLKTAKSSLNPCLQQASVKSVQSVAKIPFYVAD
jgi:hypothetical protein